MKQRYACVHISLQSQQKSIHYSTHMLLRPSETHIIQPKQNWIPNRIIASPFPASHWAPTPSVNIKLTFHTTVLFTTNTHNVTCHPHLRPISSSSLRLLKLWCQSYLHPALRRKWLCCRSCTTWKKDQSQTQGWRGATINNTTLTHHNCSVNLYVTACAASRSIRYQVILHWGSWMDESASCFASVAYGGSYYRDYYEGRFWENTPVR